MAKPLDFALFLLVGLLIWRVQTVAFLTERFLGPSSCWLGHPHCSFYHQLSFSSPAFPTSSSLALSSSALSL